MGQRRRAFCGRFAPPRAPVTWGAGLSPHGTESPIRGLFPRAAVIGSSDSDSRAARDALSSLSLSLSEADNVSTHNVTTLWKKRLDSEFYVALFDGAATMCECVHQIADRNVKITIGYDCSSHTL